MKTLYGYYAVRQIPGGSWMAWGALERLTSNHPIYERADPVHFICEATAEKAVLAVCAEMDAAYGARKWWRQAFNDAAHGGRGALAEGLDNSRAGVTSPAPARRSTKNVSGQLSLVNRKRRNT